VVLAVLAGAAAAGVSVVLAWGSGWATAGNAVLGGVVVGLLVLVLLLIAWRRDRATRAPERIAERDTPPGRRVDAR
jgi:F0F1-type ATP synthase assembly protein I